MDVGVAVDIIELDAIYDGYSLPIETIMRKMEIQY